MRRIYFVGILMTLALPLLASAQTSNFLTVEKDPDHKIFYFVKTDTDLQTIQGLESFRALTKLTGASVNAFVPDPGQFPLDGVEVRMNHCGPDKLGRS